MSSIKELVALRFGETEEYLPPTTANTTVGTGDNDELKGTQKSDFINKKRSMTLSLGPIKLIFKG